MEKPEKLDFSNDDFFNEDFTEFIKEAKERAIRGIALSDSFKETLRKIDSKYEAKLEEHYNNYSGI